MAERRDYLPVCNDKGVPLPDFQAMFCVRCVQPECSRSRAGGLFESRVAGWEDRLFRSPPRMAKSDPLFAAIAAKRFIEIDVGRVPEVDGKSDWVDPRSLEEPKTPTRRPKKGKPPKSGKGDSIESKVSIEPPAARVESPSSPRTPLNTTFRQGALLGESSGKAASKPGDPWSAPTRTAPSPAVPLVQVGAKIRFK